jgi:hypothetical protein
MTRLEQKRSMFALGAKRASLTLRKSCGSNGSRDSPVSISGGAQNPFERHRFFAGEPPAASPPHKRIFAQTFHN